MAKGKRKTTSNFINDAKKIHGDKYDYSLVEYKQSHKYIKIICLIHGVFEQTPSTHLKGRGCKNCSIQKNKIKLSKTTEQFIKEARKIHGNKYDYSLTNYINYETKIKIICPIHGVFEQRPDGHLKSNGCKKCSNNKQKMTYESFLLNSKKIHGDKYDYSLVNYVNSQSKIKIICPIHGVFEQIPNNHLSKKYGCPICNESKGEREIRNVLENNNIKFESQKTFNNLKYKRNLYFDFYLSDYNTCIEYDGKQHFESVNYFGGKKEFLIVQKRDKIKNDYCKENNIKLLRIKYDDNINIKMIGVLDTYNKIK